MTCAAVHPTRPPRRVRPTCLTSPRMRRSLSVASAIVLVAACPVRAEVASIVFPADAGHVDVTQPPYNARPDGATDCTEAIQRALMEHGSSIIYLPDGLYLVSDTLRWMGRCTRTVLQGQSVTGTVIRLRDRCAGFTDPSRPRPVILTGYAPPQRFRNAIRNLTVDTGRANDGAIGIRFNASNQGQMNTVTIRSGDGAGLIGLDMGYTGDVGPLLVERLTVEGFDVGLHTAHATAAQTLEFVTLRDQRVCGWVNDGQAVAMRRFASDNAVTAFRNKRGSSMVTLLEADCRGRDAAAGGAAIVNEGGLYARDVRTSGYRMAIDGHAGTGRSVAAASVDEFVSHPPLALFPSPDAALHLPIEETPDVPWDAPAQWVSVAKYPPKSASVPKTRTRDGRTTTNVVEVLDWTESVQQAIDSGATTVYFPRDNGSGKPYEILGTVHVRGAVRRIIGMEGGFGPESHPVFQIDDGTAPAVVIERFDWMYCPTLIRTATARDVVVGACTAYLDVGAQGRTFVEDMVTHFRVRPGGHIWLRHWNTEYTDEARHDLLGIQTADRKQHPGNLNDGGTLWALGFKTEGDGTLLTTIHGGRSEILGGLVYANKNYNPAKRAFVVRDASLSFSLGEWVIRQQPFNMVEETRKGETRLLKPGVAPGRGGGGLYVLFNGYTSGRSDTSDPSDKSDPPLSPGRGTGLTARYYVGDFGELRATRTEAVGFDGSTSAPIDDADAWSARWRGRLEARVTGSHGFGLEMPTARLLIDGEPAIDAWRNEARYRTGRLWLEAGRRYDVLLECRGTRKSGLVRWTWSEPGRAAEAVPVTQLYPATNALPEVRLSTATLQLPEKGGRLDLGFTRTGDTRLPLTVALAPRTDLTMSMVLRLAACGNAVAGRDYEPVPDRITFAPGQEQVIIPLAAIDNDHPDAPRQVRLELAASTAYEVQGGGVVVDIDDDDLPPPGNGTGLSGTYFAARDFTNPKTTRVDTAIRFEWDKAAPAPGLDPQKGFSIRWTGALEPRFTETYRLTLDSSTYCASSLWIDGRKVIEQTNDGTAPKGRFGQAGRGLDSALVPLEAGRKHAIRIDYVGLNFYGQNIALRWSSPRQYEEIVPTSQLHDAPEQPAP